MDVVDLSISKKEEEGNKTDYISNTFRNEVLEFAKEFKSSWLNLGRHLYSIHQDKMFYSWGFEKFEHYVESELGLKKSLCLKLLKVYLFVEQDEPKYLEADFISENEAINVPNYEAIDVLRKAKGNRELVKDDYDHLRKEVFDKGKGASEVKQELTAMIKERKQVDPDEERELRSEMAIKKAISALNSFKKDMEVLKLVPDEILEESKQLIGKLEGQI